MITGAVVVAFVIGLVIGFVAGLLVYRNNINLAKKAESDIRRKYDIAQDELTKLRKKL